MLYLNASLLSYKQTTESKQTNLGQMLIVENFVRPVAHLASNKPLTQCRASPYSTVMPRTRVCYAGIYYTAKTVAYYLVI